MSGTIYKCRACGAENKLEEKFCRTCGAENVLRLEKIAKLESKRKRVEKRKEKVNYRASKRKSIHGDRRAELYDKMYTRRSRRLRLEQSKLETGGTHKGKLRWVKKQLYDLKRSIPEIANDLGVSMNAVAKLVDEIKNQGSS